MKKYWKTIGLVALAAGALYYPAMRLYKAYAAKKSAATEGDEEAPQKHFAPSYLAKHKPHHRKAESNGHPA
ncbi:MAG: hypothetical protein H0X33_11025 [Taibaiella sp.]|nr:hypothetical protein [Taibaiella sp.]